MKKIVSALAMGIALSLIGCPPSPGPGTDSGKTTEAGKTTEGGDAPTTDGGTTTAPADDKVDLSHVKAGQKYTYTMTNPGAPPMSMVWEVKEVGPANVKYTITTIMDMGQGPAPVGDPQPSEWKYEVPAATTTTMADAPKVETTRETAEVSGIKFNCLVSTSGNSKVWATMSGPSSNIPTFPGMVKTETDGKVTMELTKIE